MNKEIKQIGGGLLKDRPDKRNFSRTKQFGAVTELPIEDFVVAEPLEIKDQGNDDTCVAQALAVISEDQENVLLNAYWFFAQIKKMKGDWRSWGAGLKDGCKVAVNSGFIEHEDFPIEWRQDYQGRDFLANWENWPDLYEKALLHRKKSYFKVDGPFDTFDNCRATLYANKSEKKSILVGTLWDSTWSSAPNGIIPKEKGSPMFGHAFKIFGQKTINGEIYLVAQLSNGKNTGDKGIFYFPREVVNRDFTYGAWTLEDIDPDEVKRNQWNFWQRLVWAIKSLFQDIKHYA